MLFNKKILQTYLSNFEYPKTFDAERAEKIVRNWQIALKDGNYDNTKETRVQASFLNLFFNIILGYSELNDNPDEWYLINEAKTDIDSTRPDGALGYFTKDKQSDVTRAVIELKDAKTPLDKKQTTRKDYDTPISQGFSYLSKFDRCDWVIVSNFREIRLYNKERGQGFYETFEILNLDDEKEFKRFYFCLCKENLLDKNRNSLLDNLVKDTSKNEEEISKEFYKEFKSVRLELFKHICENNPDVDKKCLLEKTQKLLDRLIFVYFCEDSLTHLLPKNITSQIYELGIKSRERSDTRIWREFKNFFIDIDEGRHDIDPPINAYNGGLFKRDEVLDNLIIKDDIWAKVKYLSENYDFESELNVNILGHIFEQSISDIEQMKAEIDGTQEDKSKSKRKKDGIFYTPEYITRYIVEQTVGKYLEENPDKLETIKILDPACGSGAFLNQAHSFLREQYVIRTEEKINSERSSKRGGQEFLQTNLLKHTNIAEADRSILLNNIFGVDLNKESTEITKLALWLKTAQKDERLQNLDNNIKCGNSLIDDPAIAGDKAFNWNEQFKDIMQNGGFDVIIGNPPYVNAKNGNFINEEKTFLYTKYETAEYQLDTYLLFIERCIKLLSNGGFLGFIIPNTILNNLYISKIRNYILKNTDILEIVESKELIFEDANVSTIVLILRKYPCVFENKVKIGKFEKQQYLFRHFADQKNFLSNENFIYNINVSEEKTVIIKHICKCSLNASNILDISTGIKEYQVGKGNPKQTQKDKDLLKFNAYYKKDFTYIPEIRGKNINRYNTIWKNEYVSYGEWLAEPRNSRFFEGERIVLRKIPGIKNLILNLVNNDFVIDQSLYIGKIKNNEFSIKYVLAILNSILTCWYFKNVNNEFDELFPQIKINQFKTLPIPNANKEQQESLAKKAEQMIELNKELYSGVDSALSLIKEQYQPQKISQNLEKFYTLGIHPFVEELEKQKVKLSLSQKEELINWYNEKSAALNDLKSKIDTLDKAIDDEVYKLYNLTDDEIKIIEES
jgi:type I restriction-modification system DNA methylase subunit